MGDGGVQSHHTKGGSAAECARYIINTSYGTDSFKAFLFLQDFCFLCIEGGDTGFQETVNC